METAPSPSTLGKTALMITGTGTAASRKQFTYATPTGTATSTVTYQTYTVQTAFQCTNVTEYNLSQDLVHTITLADGSVYQFNYETTPQHPSNVTGRLASLTLPQGGVITYQYTGGNKWNRLCGWHAIWPYQIDDQRQSNLRPKYHFGCQQSHRRGGRSG